MAAVVTSKGVTKTVRQGYLLFLPRGYDTSPGKRWPLILYLHGVGSRDRPLDELRTYGVPLIAEEQPDFLFIVLSPQCPAEVMAEDILWSNVTGAVDELLGDVLATYAVDPDRVYLTGFSMGGYGTWLQAMLYPGRFAAIAPISGGGDPAAVCALKDVPVWAFHGDQDRVVPLPEVQALVDALRACDGDVRLTVYPNTGHTDALQAYQNPELYTWFLEHVRP
ncbi:MAG: prolyl oligopeptidase family serine peptidase [Chloroflexi bacterium]|nr:prolyl oligopeptidase family serine peptidase [Chloroflexota bacterium]MBU1748128.1 prolyl oligopeptidase family serine peptidase [Chloroflexota bacterium]MBU1878062.1 prolyl oligopeptidase family serine peptidase [Chloroflexota bacterium]